MPNPLTVSVTTTAPVVPQQYVTQEQVDKMFQEKRDSKKNCNCKGIYQHPFPTHVEWVPYKKNSNIPQFTKFDGKGCLRRHLAHFVTACRDTDTSNNGNLLLRFFDLSLEGPAFDWYLHLKPNSVQTWEDMQRLFL